MTCEKCGNKNVAWASYCTRCGVSLGWICKCSFINNKENIYCGGCGISLQNNDSSNDSSDGVELYVNQYSKQQISDLIKESIYFKASNTEKLDQSDIDNIFFNGDEITA